MSPLNDLEHFHVANNQLPQDVMHIMLEGVLPYEVQLMLTVFVKDKKYFTLDRLNERIKCYPYTQGEVGDRPSPIVLGTSSSQVAIHQSGNDNLNLHAAQYLKSNLHVYTKSTLFRSTCHSWEVDLKRVDLIVKGRYIILYL